MLGITRSTQHIPYRNNPLTKLLKSSLGGNNKTAIIVCVSPTKLQFNHSLQTFKFALNARSIENSAHRNVIANNSEETLKLLIQEYQQRLASVEGVKEAERSQSEWEELRAENRMLLEQVQKTEEIGRPLLKFVLSDKEEVDCVIENETKGEGKEIFEMEIVKKCIEALRIKCKESYMWQKEVQKLQELNRKFAESKQSTSFDTAEETEEYISTCKSIIQDYLKLIKAQSIKLDVYESMDKYVPLLSSAELAELAGHFKSLVEKLQVCDGSDKARSCLVKMVPRNILYTLIAKASTMNKVTINSRYNEAYVASFLLKKFSANEGSFKSTSSSSEKTEAEYDKATQNCLNHLKEIQKLIKNSSFRNKQSDTSVETPKHSRMSEATSSKEHGGNTDWSPPKSSKSSGGLGEAHSFGPRVVGGCGHSQGSPKKCRRAPQRENVAAQEQKAQVSLCCRTVKGPVLKRNYRRQGTVEAARAVQESPLRSAEADEGKEDSFGICDTEILLTKNVLEMSKPLNPERKAELKELQKIVNQMYME